MQDKHQQEIISDLVLFQLGTKHRQSLYRLNLLQWLPHSVAWVASDELRVGEVCACGSFAMFGCRRPSRRSKNGLQRRELKGKELGEIAVDFDSVGRLNRVWELAKQDGFVDVIIRVLGKALPDLHGLLGWFVEWLDQHLLRQGGEKQVQVVLVKLLIACPELLHPLRCDDTFWEDFSIRKIKLKVSWIFTASLGQSKCQNLSDVQEDCKSRKFGKRSNFDKRKLRLKVHKMNLGMPAAIDLGNRIVESLMCNFDLKKQKPEHKSNSSK